MSPTLRRTRREYVNPVGEGRLKCPDFSDLRQVARALAAHTMARCIQVPGTNEDAVTQSPETIINNARSAYGFSTRRCPQVFVTRSREEPSFVALGIAIWQSESRSQLRPSRDEVVIWLVGVFLQLKLAHLILIASRKPSNSLLCQAAQTSAPQRQANRQSLE